MRNTPADGQPVARLLLNERDAAAALGVGVRTMLNLRDRDGLPFVRVGSRVMYRPADLAAWVDGRRTVEAAAKTGGDHV